MKTKSYNVYSFAELPPKARQRAIDDHCEFLGNNWDSKPIIEDAKRALAFAGFDVERVGFSGFWSQGDGAHFEGSWKAENVNPAAMREYAPQDTELHRIADELATIAERWPIAVLTVKHSGRYSHEYCTDFDIVLDGGDYIPCPGDEKSDFERDEKALTGLARDAMRWIYRQLEKDYDYCTDEPQVIASLEANKYEFTENGEID